MNRSWSCRALLPATVLVLTACAGTVADDAPSCKGVVGRLGETTLTLEQLDAQVLARNAKLAQSLFDARNRALEAWLSDHMLELEAKAQKTTPDELLRKEQGGGVSDADVEAFYNQNKARLGGRSLEDAKFQILPILERQQAQNARTRLISRLKSKYAARNLLEPPRVEVRIADNAARKGPDTAAVRIVEFSDFQ